MSDYEEESAERMSNEEFSQMLNNRLNVMRMKCDGDEMKKRCNTIELQAKVFFLSAFFYLLFAILWIFWAFFCDFKRLESSDKGKGLLRLHKRLLGFLFIQSTCVTFYPIANWLYCKLLKVAYFMLSFLILPILLNILFPFLTLLKDITYESNYWGFAEGALLLSVFICFLWQFVLSLRKVLMVLPVYNEPFGRRFVGFVGIHASFFVYIYCLTLITGVVALMRPDFSGQMDNFQGFFLVYALCLVMTAIIGLQLTLLCLVRNQLFLWIYTMFCRKRCVTSFTQDTTNNDVYFQ